MAGCAADGPSRGRRGAAGAGAEPDKDERGADREEQERERREGEEEDGGPIAAWGARWWPTGAARTEGQAAERGGEKKKERGGGNGEGEKIAQDGREDEDEELRWCGGAGRGAVAEKKRRRI